jgi:hypothetical protein
MHNHPSQLKAARNPRQDGQFFLTTEIIFFRKKISAEEYSWAAVLVPQLIATTGVDGDRALRICGPPAVVGFCICHPLHLVIIGDLVFEVFTTTDISIANGL